MSARVVVPSSTDAPSLTVQQMAVLGLLADGLTAEHMARRLGISLRAVRTTKGRLHVLLEAGTDAQAVHRAHVLGLLAFRRPAVSVQSDPGLGQGSSAERGPVAESRGALTWKPRATAGDARRIAARLEAGFKGAQR